VKLLLAAGIYQLFDHSLVFLAAGAAIAVFLVATLSNEALLPIFDTVLRPLSKLGVCQWWPARVTWATDKVEAEMAEVTDAPQDLDRRGGNRANRDER
jgi:hypothetical protein